MIVATPEVELGQVGRINTLVATNFFRTVKELEDGRRVRKSGGRAFSSIGGRLLLRGPGVMRAKAGLIPVVAAALTASAVAGYAGTAHAQDAPAVAAAETCLAAPSGKAPAGSHWHYHTDPATQGKCWHLTTDAGAAQKPATQETTETGTAATATPAAGESATQDATAARPARAKSSSKPARGNTQNGHQARTPNGAQGGSAQGANAPRANAQGANTQGGSQDARAQHQAGDAAAPWPDPPRPQAGGGEVPWPDPAPLAAGATQQAAGSAPSAAATAADNGPATQPSAAQPSAMQAATPSGDQAAANGQAAASPTAAAASDNDEMPLGLLAALAGCMLVAGVLVRRIVKALFARRANVVAERREPSLQTSAAGERPKAEPHTLQPGLSPDWVERLDQDVQSELRNLLRTLEQRAA